jgi:hypothetical protein
MARISIKDHRNQESMMASLANARSFDQPGKIATEKRARKIAEKLGILCIGGQRNCDVRADEDNSILVQY